MTEDLALQLMAQMLGVGLLVAAPILGLSMLAGLLVSVVQVVAQIQEMSLTFVPTLLVVAAVMVAFGPWMLGKLLAYASALIGGIPAYV